MLRDTSSRLILYRLCKTHTSSTMVGMLMKPGDCWLNPSINALAASNSCGVSGEK